MKSGATGLKDKIENLADQTQELAETAFKIARIEAIEKITKIASTTVLMSVLLLLVNFLFFFIGIGAARWIGDMLGDLKLGYFIVGGFYLALIFIILVLRKKVIIPFIRNIIVQKLYE